MTTQEKIAVMQAFIEGKTIQFKISKDCWIDIIDRVPVWNWGATKYRVKPEPTLPKTWEEFSRHALDKGYLPNKELADAMLALSQLIQLRDCYNDGWQPDWKDDAYKYVIFPFKNDIEWKDYKTYSHYVLAFKTADLRNTFYVNFKDLIEIAKPLL